METREIYWNIQGVWIMYLLLAVTLAIFARGAYRHYRLLALGRPEDRFDNWRVRAGHFALHALAQVRSLLDRYSGAMHLMFFWGFVFLFVGTLVVFLEADLRIPVMRGPFYLYFQSLVLDIVGLLAIVGICMAVFKRYVLRPDRLLNPARLRTPLVDGAILGLILAILATGFVLEGARIVATSDPWGDWSPVGKATGLALQGLGLEGEALLRLHRITWWLHLVMALAFIAYIPYSKLRHIFFAAANVYLRSLAPMGALKPVEMESAETLGAAKLEDLTWKQILDLEACTECGRCQEACPAYAAGQPLSPKAVILDLRNGLCAAGDGPTRCPTADSLGTSPGEAGDGEESPAIAAVTADSLWSCVTCGSCMEQCPVFVEHVPTIVDMRRYLVMERAEYPELMQEALTSMEARGHPFRGTPFSRTDWCEGLDVDVVADAGPAEWLYWLGCAAAFDERSQKIARAFATLLRRAGVHFAVLGDEERCTGDAARRIGNEYLYQMMAQANIETLNRYGIKKIVTTCPHCFNTLKHEYPQLGGSFQVHHHTELLSSLLRQGKLQTLQPIPERLTLHDSCYLARYNGVVDPPRAVVAALPGAALVEMDLRRRHTFCCGGGGGHMWFEETQGRRINHERADQVLATGCSTVAAACPFCVTMLTDGVNARKGEREVAVFDVAELLERATRPPSGA